MAHAETLTQSAPQIVTSLVERFVQNRDAYRGDAYNETQVRREFIDPLFKALGWDIDNGQGLAEAYKDVIHEDAIKIGGATKAPDYCFRIGGTRKFFVEAKKPAVGIRDDPEPAYQLRRYAWSAKLPLSILTDFEELAVYDCRLKPHKNDRQSKGRILYFTCDEYVARWGELALVFSKEAVLKGSFDKYAETARGKRGTAAVDESFLEEIESWREALARNFALRNPRLSVRDLNFAVERTIDRIIFLRMCEDRGIESYAQLRDLLNGHAVYARLAQLFRAADDRYNAGLFYFRQEPDRGPPDELTLNLSLDDKVLKDILSKLYYPDCPYEFSVLSADILGQVYEQFLGKVIRLTPGHRAVVEEKPEVRKAGGVYYTPTYIVDYIVRHTVGRLLEGKTPTDVGPDRETKSGRAKKLARGAGMLRVLDPACGSGSFLLGAYQHLLDWHRDWYVNDGPERHRLRIYQGAAGQWRLSIREKKRILLNNIYGVDIDPQAVEVTKLSLLLKVLEGETAQTIGSTLRLFHERALPDLSNNIKCGNSLIGPDFFSGREQDLFDEEERYRINAFDWRREFAEAMEAGGFDAVVGNPPWGQKEIEKDSGISRFLRERFTSLSGIFDLFRPFIEQGIRLAARGGCFGMVLPDIVLLKNYVETRRYILQNLSISEIDWWGMAFQDAVIDAATLIGSRNDPTDAHKVRARIHGDSGVTESMIPQADFWENDRLTFNIHLSTERRELLRHFDAFPRLADDFEIHEGVHSGNIRNELFVDRRMDASCRELLFGREEIAPYSLHWNGKYVRLSAIPSKKSPRRYANAGRPEWYDRQKLVVRRTGDYVLAAIDRDRRYVSNNFFVVFPMSDGALPLDLLCAILNSPLMTWYYRTIEPRRGRVFAELKIKHLERFPLPGVADDQRVARLTSLSSQRQDIAERICRTNTAPQRVTLERAALQVDAQIHAAVLDLYELPDQYRVLVDRETNDAAKKNQDAA